MMIKIVLIGLSLITASWKAEEIDPSDIDACFTTVFSKLPNEVTIYPSENYYYWKITPPGGEIVRGNLRLAANRRDRGELSFAVGQNHKAFSADDGVRVERASRFEYRVTFRDKCVTFRLNQLTQEPPEEFSLREGERFVQRTYDESGHQFILLYDTRYKDFLWLLNEEEGVESPEPLASRDGALVGQKTGFVFWQDKNRKVLVAVSSANVSANNEFDGPFDQLADNHASETPLQQLLIHRNPDLDGQINQFGIYKNRQPETRVALVNYLQYETIEEALSFLREANDSQDACRHISRGRREE
ncbi:MAG: hypothetical protein ACR2RV_22745 [Verrucomicrobiales bacterium]